MKMLDIHVKRDAIDAEEGHIMHGAMSYKAKGVESIMTPIEQVYALPVNCVSVSIVSCPQYAHH